MAGADEAIVRARQDLNAEWEAANVRTDAYLSAHADEIPGWAIAAWEQFKARERERRRLRPPGSDVLDLLDF